MSFTLMLPMLGNMVQLAHLAQSLASIDASRRA